MYRPASSTFKKDDINQLECFFFLHDNAVFARSDAVNTSVSQFGRLNFSYTDKYLTFYINIQNISDIFNFTSRSDGLLSNKIAATF